jgi:hypothetical protein
MALKDFLFKDSYTTITNIQYEKYDKRIQFTLGVYADKERTKLVNTMNYILGVSEEIPGFGEKEFENFFGVKALEAKSNNLLAAIYNYLKTRDEFSKVKDA